MSMLPQRNHSPGKRSTKSPARATPALIKAAKLSHRNVDALYAAAMSCLGAKSASR
jgi:hypothetical protein